MRPSFAHLTVLVLCAPGAANAGPQDASCERQIDAVASDVERALDARNVPWVEVGRRVDFWCTGEVATLERRLDVGFSQIYFESVYSNGTRVLNHVTRLDLPQFQPSADPGSAVAIAQDRVVIFCPDGSATILREGGNDVPADIGQAAGSNPNIVDFDGDDWLSLVHVECTLP